MHACATASRCGIICGYQPAECTQICRYACGHVRTHLRERNARMGTFAGRSAGRPLAIITPVRLKRATDFVISDRVASNYTYSRNNEVIFVRLRK